MLFYMLTKSYPWRRWTRPDSVHERILSGECLAVLEETRGATDDGVAPFTPATAMWLARMLARDPLARPTVAELLAALNAPAPL
jgi:hypothetical protein